MVARYCRQSSAGFMVWMLVTWVTILFSHVRADGTRWIPYTTDEGTVYFDDNRRPALYTTDFGDCQGDSLINVTRFDASLYRDNLTVMFHMAGSSAFENERVMMYFSVFAYGENRFNLTFNPCVINIPTMCPLNASIPIEANGMIPIGPQDVAGIPSIAFSIPDFEGQAILRLFSNKNRTQIACYSAKLNNGNSFSHPSVVGSVLGIFTAVALFSSVAVTIYGEFVSDTRIHYAHSMSVFVVFSVLQHVFFTGGLSMNWPSVLVAFWSNYAWSAGMIYSKKMQNSINQFIGSNRGNISMVGSAPSNQNFASLGGGFQINQIYSKAADATPFEASQLQEAKHSLQRRMLVNSSTGFNWYGGPVAAGLPLPGNYSGFAGTLAQLEIPASNAFLTGLLWLLILLLIVVGIIVTVKLLVEVFSKLKFLKTDRLDFFRSHWIRFTFAAAQRTCYIAFFMITYLALFQFALGGSRSVIIIAAITFAIFVVGMFGLVIYALWHRLRRSTFRVKSDKFQVVSKAQRGIPRFGVTRQSSGRVIEAPLRVVNTIPWFQPHFVDPDPRPHVHDDEEYNIKFGWLSSRFRRSKWWFFSAWLFYELGRACFYGAAAGHALVQVFGLLAWEIIAFIVIVMMRPFESNRLNLIMVYLLGFSKVATVALSSAFDPRFGLSRILTTVLGVAIILIQGVLTICLMVAITLGAISTYMSLTRNHDDFKPLAWTNYRLRYFAHIQQKATDKPRPPPSPPPPEPEKPKGPYFTVSSVRREPKIEDEAPDKEMVEEIFEVGESPLQESSDDLTVAATNPQVSRVNSVKSRSSVYNLPYGARSHRHSWSVRDLSNQSTEQLPSGLHSRMSVDSMREAPMRYRAASMKDLSHNAGIFLENTDSQAQRHRRTRSTSTPFGRHRRHTPSLDVNTAE